MKNIFKYKDNYIFLNAIVIIILLIVFIFLQVLNPGLIIERAASIKINNIARFNSQLNKVYIAFVCIVVLILLYFYIKKESLLSKYNPQIEKLTNYFSKIFSFKVLLVVTLIYICILSFYAITRYDLGTDEAGYLVYARTFYHNSFPYIYMNGTELTGQIWTVNNFQMLPYYLFSNIQFMFNLVDVWHFKLFATAISVISLFFICFIFNRFYDLRHTIILLLLLTIQPGFGFVSCSYFGEITQGAFFFWAIYLWLKEEKINLTPLRISLISFLFTIAAHTKPQISLPLILSLLCFHFVDRSKKSLNILFYFLAFFILLSLIRFVPALIQDKTILMKMVKFWYLTIAASGLSNIYKLQKLLLLNRFFSVILSSLILIFSYFVIKKTFEKFIYIFSIIYILWFTFSYPLTTYRHLFIGLIPLLMILTVLIVSYYERYKETQNQKLKYVRPIMIFIIVLLMLWGFSSNIIYAIVGYNDGVQFDMDGNKNILFYDIKHDNTQKNFYNKLRSYISSGDSIFISSGGGPILTTEFYLPENPIYDFEHFKTALDSSNTRKYLIIDRVSYPLGLEPGRKSLDSLHVNHQLLIKEGDFEFYGVSK